MREWLNRAVSKTVEPSRAPWVRIPPSPPGLGSETLTSGRFHCHAWPADCGSSSGAPTGSPRIAVAPDLRRSHNSLLGPGEEFEARLDPAGERWNRGHAVSGDALRLGSEEPTNPMSRWGIRGLRPALFLLTEKGVRCRWRPDVTQSVSWGMLRRIAESAYARRGCVRIPEGALAKDGEWSWDLLRMVVFGTEQQGSRVLTGA